MRVRIRVRVMLGLGLGLFMLGVMWLGCWDDNEYHEFYLVAGYLNNQKKCPPMDAETCKHYLDGLEEGCDDYDYTHAKQLLRERLAEIV